MMRRAALTAVVALSLALSACAGTTSSSAKNGSPSSTSMSPASTTTTPAAWARIDRALSQIAPAVSLLAARVSPDGTCHPVHELASSARHPTGSQFKLFVLGALAKKIAAGEIKWDDKLTVEDAQKSVGNGPGSLQLAAGGSSVTVEQAAAKMISISDNTAADMLLRLVDRDAVEAQARAWMADATANNPFLTTRELFMLHYVPGLAQRYLATPADQRAAFLAADVDPRPLADLGAGYTPKPRLVDTIEWFATPRDICRAFAGLQVQSKTPSLAPLSGILSGEVRGLALSRSEWPTVWYKGGSESGVLTMGWLATNDKGQTFVVEAMLTNPDAALPDDSLTKVVALAKDAYALLG